MEHGWESEVYFYGCFFLGTKKGVSYISEWKLGYVLIFLVFEHTVSRLDMFPPSVSDGFTGKACAFVCLFVEV